MRRFGAGLACAVLLLGLLPFTLSGCFIACGCTSTPDPNWTPPPISAQEAAVYASKFAGYAATLGDMPGMTASPTGGPNGRSFYIATAANTVVLVAAISGMVVEVLLEGRMPDDATASASTADARTAAEAFMGRTGMSTDGLTESVQAVRGAGVAAYQVEWKQAGGMQDAQFEVLVNASTGSVFAFVDQRMQLNVSAPMVGQGRATELAIAALGVPGDQATSAELSIDFSTGSQASAWQIGLGVPSATQADVFEHGALVRIDAITGEATIIKS